MVRAPMFRRLARFSIIAIWLGAAWSVAPPSAAGSGPPPIADGMPVVGADQERAVVALIRPIELGQEVVPGWFLDRIQLDMSNIRFEFHDRQGGERSIVLEYPGRVPRAIETTKSFAVVREVPAGAPTPAQDPLDLLVDSIRKNDAGTFWASAPVPVPRRQSVDREGGGDLAPDDRPGGSSLGRDWRRIFRGLSGDGIVLFLGGLIFVLAHLKRALRDDPPWMATALLGLMVAGAALRAILPQENLMEAWPYERLAPLAGRIFNGPVLRWLNEVAGGGLYLTDVLFASNYALAMVMPLVMYAHARYVLRDHRSALAAAALVVVIPEHLRFSRSDVYMIQSLATSSLTFVVLYGALTDRSPLWRLVSFLALPLLCIATYFVRPENIIFVGLDLGAIYICTRSASGLSPRALSAAAIVLTTALMAFISNLLANYGSNIAHGLSLQTLLNAVYIFFNFRLNTLVNPWITPPAVTLLAVLGGVWLWRWGDRRRAIFLVIWLGGYFVVHSFVLPYHPAMQARYHMNLVTPLVLLAAAATPAVLTWRPLARYVLVAYLAASPFLHRDFIADTDFNEMREFSFLTSLRDLIPPECTVVEYSGLPGEGPQTNQFASRVGRVSARLMRGELGQSWTVVPAVTVDGDAPTLERERISAEAEALLTAAPSCLVFYEGLTCASLRREGEQRASICQTMHDRLDLEPFASTTFASRIYDPVMSGFLEVDGPGRTRSRVMLPEGVPVTLTAFRARSRESGM